MRRLLITLTLFTVTVVNMLGQTKNPSFEAYINKYKDLAIQLQQQYRIPASIKLAQALLESDAGRSNLARKSNNHFGIKCKEEWRGNRVYHDDDAKNECFRAYSSVEDSYLDHAKFLAERKYYVSLFSLDIYDYRAWAYGLQKCGYATDKLYGSKLVGIIESYGLYKYDKARITERQPVIEEQPEIKLIREFEKKHPELINWRRRLHQVNGIHYITAQTNDTYEIIAYDARMKLKRLLKYNETTKEHKLENGDIVFLQNKQKQASKGTPNHVVKSGESMYSIAQLYGIKVKSLYKFNKLKDGYVPKPGDILKVRKK